MANARTIVGLGEALFDVFGDEAHLGGAPLNVAVHAQQLGNHGIVVSRVGQDDMGRQVRDELTKRGMSVDYLQTDPDRPTGTVIVGTGPDGEPTYDIVNHVAWDVIQYDPDLDALARRTDAVCFGSLAQREAQSRNNIYRFAETARQAVRLFDVNLRQDYFDRRSLTRSCEIATALKLNTAELRTLDDLFNLGGSFDDAAATLLKRFDLHWLALTRGPDGVVVYTPGGKFEGEPVSVDTSGSDAVGAGDATAAALLHGVTHRWPWPRTIAMANHLGAFVASQKGACPQIPQSLQNMAQ